MNVRPALKNASAGMTLIEVVVVISIIGLLIALLIPAVQSARGAAQRSACSNNLRQVGLAVLSYESAQGCLPMGSGSNTFSFQVAVLPYLEQAAIFNSINLGFNGIFAPPQNRTATQTVIGTLLCPSDNHPPTDATGCVNYVGNRGVAVQAFGYNGAFILSQQGVVHLRDFTDGTDQTALASEWLTGDGENRDPDRAVFKTPSELTAPSQLDAFSSACRDLDPLTAELNHPFKGRSWWFGDCGFTLYNHTLTPGQHTCTNGSAFQQGAWTAGSRHPGGVNVLFGDSHIQFIRSTITLNVWRALGSRNGGEAVSSSSY